MKIHARHRGSTSTRITAAGAFFIVVAALLAACATSTSVPSAAAPLPLPCELALLTTPGPQDVVVETGSFTSAYGCEVEYEIHAPAQDAAPVSVVLAHGFQDSLDAMRRWAELWASRGVRTAVLNFCNSTWRDGRHDRNAEDMIALADILLDSDQSLVGSAGGAGVIYAGFSAGGLSALLAAVADPRTTAYLGLDPVDSGDLADRASGYDGPAFHIFAAPSSCNADNNMIPKLTGRPGEVAVRVPYATHCDFRNPYTAGCELLCGRVKPEETAEQVRATIVALSTAWIVGHAENERMIGFLSGDMLTALERQRRIERLELD